MTTTRNQGVLRRSSARAVLTVFLALSLVGCAVTQPRVPGSPVTPPSGSLATPEAAPVASTELPAQTSLIPPSEPNVPAQAPGPVADTLVVPAGVAPATDPAVLVTLLREAYQFRLLSASQLAAETERLGLQAPTAENRLRWALALAQTLQIQDTQRALGLIQTVLESPDEPSVALRPLAHLLGHLLREQQRLDLQNERLSQQLRESQRRVEQLSDRIEAMRAIERSLNRPAPLSVPPRPTPP